MKSSSLGFIALGTHQCYDSCHVSLLFINMPLLPAWLRMSQKPSDTSWCLRSRSDGFSQYHEVWIWRCWVRNFTGQQIGHLHSQPCLLSLPRFGGKFWSWSLFRQLAAGVGRRTGHTQGLWLSRLSNCFLSIHTHALSDWQPTEAKKQVFKRYYQEMSG